VTLKRYTPLYRPLECMQQESGLGPMKTDGTWVNITGAMRKDCTNPNGYAVQVGQRSIGQVFVLVGNSTLKPIGMSYVPEVSFPAHGQAIGESRMEIAVPMAEATALLATPVLRVVSEIHVRSEASLSFFGIGMRSGEDKEEFCGFELRMATKKVGPSACAATLAELVIPGVDTAPELRLVHMDPEHLSKQARKKNVAFSVILVLCGVLAASSLHFAARNFRGGWRQARDPEANVQVAEQV
jgi:hypothetical protein